MHDLDRTLLETESPAAVPYLGEPGSAESEDPLSTEQQIGFANQLLEVSNDRELDQFLGDVLRTVGTAAGRFASSAAGRAVAGVLKPAVKQALSAAGRAVGGWVSPGGGDLGSQLATQAGQLLGLELEGLSPEDREFEVSRQLVRLTSSAAEQASHAPRDADPVAVAHHAVATAAQQYAPGLLRRLPGDPVRALPRSGRWIRSGQTIILYGC